MSLVYSRDDHMFRVDGDVLETFIDGSSAHRVLLTRLMVRVLQYSKFSPTLYIGSAPLDEQLYEVRAPNNHGALGRGSPVRIEISSEEEPALRDFFDQVALLCDRPVASGVTVLPSEKPSRRRR
jgi:hypothetical protein